MAKDADKVVIASNGTVYAAPVGTTAPTNVATSLNAGFIDLGYVTEAGVTATLSKTVQSIGAWQSGGQPVRRMVVNRNMRVAFELMEWKEVSLELATDGQVGNMTQIITMSNWDGVESFKLTYNGSESAAFVRGTNATAAAIQTALRTLTGDTALTVTGTTDAGPFTVTFSSEDSPIYTLSVTSPSGNNTGAVTKAEPWQLFPADSDDVITWALVIEWEDGANTFRLYLPRAMVTEDTVFNLTRTDAATLPVTVEATVDADSDFAWKLFSNMASFDPDTE